MGILRTSDFAERGDVDEADYRHLWTGTYEVRIAGTDRYYRIDPATGAVRRIDGFSVDEKGRGTGAAGPARDAVSQRRIDELAARDESAANAIGFASDKAATLRRQRADKVARAQALAAEGLSLYEVARTLGVTKDWLREYAGL